MSSKNTTLVYSMAAVKPSWLRALPTVTTTGWFPDGALAGTTALT